MERDKYIEFTSDRKPVKVELDSIKVVESNDDEVWVSMSDGADYAPPNQTANTTPK